jgi:hypothetical protein
MKLLIMIATVLALTATASVAQQAPKGCIACEAMCKMCASLGIHPKDTSKCSEGCRRWGTMVGLKTVYVKNSKSLCRASNFAPRCN